MVQQNELLASVPQLSKNKLNNYPNEMSIQPLGIQLQQSNNHPKPISKVRKMGLHCSVIYGDGFTEEKLFKRSGPIFSIAQLCHHPTVSVSSSSEVQQEEDQQRKGIDPFQDQHFRLQAKLKTRGDRTGQDVDESSGPIRCSSPLVQSTWPLDSRTHHVIFPSVPTRTLTWPPGWSQILICVCLKWRCRA